MILDYIKVARLYCTFDFKRDSTQSKKFKDCNKNKTLYEDKDNYVK